MPLGTEVDLGPGHIVLDGDLAPRERGLAALSLFSAHVYCGHGCPSQLLLRSLAKVVSLDDFIFHLYKPKVEPYPEVQFLPMLKLTAVCVECY